MVTQIGMPSTIPAKPLDRGIRLPVGPLPAGRIKYVKFPRHILVSAVLQQLTSKRNANSNKATSMRFAV
jgi:hypothetical protein